MSPSSHSLFSWDPSHVSTELDGEVVVLNPTTGIYCNLDPLSSEIWRLLERPSSPQDICAVLVPRYRGEPATMLRDISHLIRQLQQLGLLQESSA